jgi:hypothetical protein
MKVVAVAIIAEGGTAGVGTKECRFVHVHSLLQDAADRPSLQMACNCVTVLPADMTRRACRSQVNKRCCYRSVWSHAW